MSDLNSVPFLVNVPDYGLVKILANPSTQFLNYMVDGDIVTVRWGINGYSEVVTPQLSAAKKFTSNSKELPDSV